MDGLVYDLVISLGFDNIFIHHMSGQQIAKEAFIIFFFFLHVSLTRLVIKYLCNKKRTVMTPL